MRLPKLRLHLLTCVVLMFVAGALLWANLGDYARMPHSHRGFIGWPIWVYELTVEVGPKRAGGRSWSIYWDENPSRDALIVDVIVGISLLVIVGVVCELLLRSRSSTSSPSHTAGK